MINALLFFARSVHMHFVYITNKLPCWLASRAVSLSDSQDKALRCLNHQDSNIPVGPLIVDRLSLRASDEPIGSLALSEEPVATCVLKKHPLLRHAVAAALRTVAIPPTLGISVRVVWKSTLPSFSEGEVGGKFVCEHQLARHSLLAPASN